MDTTGERRGTAGVVLVELTCPAAAAELAADMLWRAGARGVEERSVLDGTGHDTSRRCLVAAVGPFRLDQARATAMWAAVHRAAEQNGWSARLTEVPSDYAELWREHVTTVEIDDRLEIVPAWHGTEDPVAADRRLTVAIEPAGAFGLGDHPTTRLCAGIVARECRSGERSVLDVGCGSGVLSVIAARLGARPVRAIDVAPAAIAATVANAARNGLEHGRIMADTTPVGDLSGRYDLVVANVLAPTLIEMARDLRRLTRSTLVLSGLLAGRHGHVAAAMGPMRTVAVETLDGWAAVILQP